MKGKTVIRFVTGVAPKPAAPSVTFRATIPPMETATQLKADPRNPNRMGADDKARMAQALAEFGDLGGIMINRRTGYLVGGHQRSSVLHAGDLHVEDLVKPEADGTVARGYLLHGGRRYAVRVVDWPEEKAHAAMLAANRFGRVGQDDAQILKDLLQELDSGAMNMDLTGFTAEDIEKLMTCDTPMKPISVQAPPRMAWVLIGVPIGLWGKVAPYAEEAAKIEGSVVETTVNDGIQKD